MADTEYHNVATNEKNSLNEEENKVAVFPQNNKRSRRRGCRETCKVILMAEYEDVRKPTFWRAILAEFIGVALLVMFAIASGMSDEKAHPNGLVFVCLESGIFIAVIIGNLVHISGGHVNPAVSLGFAIAGDISWIRFILYTVAHIVGSIAGAAIIRVVAPANMYGNFGVIAPGPGVSDVHAMMMELIITFFLMFSILAAVDSGRKDSIGSVPLHVGLAVCVNMFVAINISGAAMNPIRAFGPAVITGDWTSHWAYWIGPLGGAALGALAYDKVFSTRIATKGLYKFCLRRSSRDADRSSEHLSNTALNNDDKETFIEMNEKEIKSEVDAE